MGCISENNNGVVWLDEEKESKGRHKSHHGDEDRREINEREAKFRWQIYVMQVNICSRKQARASLVKMN